MDIQIGAGALLAGTEYLTDEKTTPAGTSVAVYTRSDGTEGVLTLLDALGGKVRLKPWWILTRSLTCMPNIFTPDW